jgi:hypothetical protein
MFKVLNGGVVYFGLGCLSSASVGGLRREDDKRQREDGEDFHWQLRRSAVALKDKKNCSLTFCTILLASALALSLALSFLSSGLPPALVCVAAKALI